MALSAGDGLGSYLGVARVAQSMKRKGSQHQSTCKTYTLYVNNALIRTQSTGN